VDDARRADPALIALVDDDRDFLEMNRGVLQGRGYRVVCFTDADQAWASIAVRKPALVITDLMMRSLDSGFALARRIKSEPSLRNLPVIIVTAVGAQRGLDFSPHSSADLEAMRADAFFDKPVSPRELVAKVQELLG
jgi:two-component system alkaline phosphatase synthesis response regulator PhoP